MIWSFTLCGTNKKSGTEESLRTSTSKSYSRSVDRELFSQLQDIFSFPNIFSRLICFGRPLEERTFVWGQ